MFERALAIARRHPSCREFGEGKNLRVRLHFRWTELQQVKEFKDAAWELHNKQAFLNGQEVKWETMAQVTWCFYERTTRRKEQHCFFDENFVNPWGCRYALANLDPRISCQWLQFGQLDGSGAFQFDRQRMRAWVSEHIQQGYHHCPAFDPEFTRMVADVFPEKIDPNDDGRWRYIQKPGQPISGVAPNGVGNAWKVAKELQSVIRARRGPDSVLPTGKRLIPPSFLPEQASSSLQKKSLFARIFGK
jgi:hypothetical protein